MALDPEIVREIDSYLWSIVRKGAALFGLANLAALAALAAYALLFVPQAADTIIRAAIDRPLAGALMKLDQAATAATNHIDRAIASSTASLSTSISTLMINTGDIQRQALTAQTTYADLTSRNNMLSTTIATFEQALSKIQDADLLTKIRTASDQIDKIAAIGGDSNMNAIAQLQTTVTSAIDQLNTLRASVDALKSANTSAPSKTDLDSLKTRVAMLDGTTAASTSSLQTVSNRVDALQSYFGGRDIRLMVNGSCLFFQTVNNAGQFGPCNNTSVQLFRLTPN